MDAKVRAALDEALADEYKARATYTRVIEAFGPVQPFVNILESEGRHIGALYALYAAHGISPPADDWQGRIDAPATVAEACKAAVEAEIENAAMYERLLNDVGDPEIRRVLERLRAASRDNHLPAFERCLDREGAGEATGTGRRRRHRYGRRS